MTCQECRVDKPESAFFDPIYRRVTVRTCRACLDSREDARIARNDRAPLPPPNTRPYRLTCLYCSRDEWFALTPRLADLAARSGLLRPCPHCGGPRQLEESRDASPGGPAGARVGTRLESFWEAA